MGYIWAYVERQEPLPSLVRERPFLLDVSYEVDLWGDNVEHPRMSEYMRTTSDSQVYKQARMFMHDIWEFDPYYRACRQLPGGYGAHMSWKENRTHQYKGSARV